MNPNLFYMMNPWIQQPDYYAYAKGRRVRPGKTKVDPTRNLDTNAERMANPQVPVHTWGGQPVTQTGFILPYGRGAYRHGFDGCGVCGGLGAETEQGMPFMAWLLILGMGATLAYTLLQTPKRT